MKFMPEHFLTGIGLTFSASVLLPMLKSAAKPALAGGMAGVTLGQSQIRKGLEFVREEYEDFTAEVQFERLKRQFGKR